MQQIVDSTAQASMARRVCFALQTEVLYRLFANDIGLYILGFNVYAKYNSIFMLQPEFVSVSSLDQIFV